MVEGILGSEEVPLAPQLVQSPAGDYGFPAHLGHSCPVLQEPQQGASPVPCLARLHAVGTRSWTPGALHLPLIWHIRVGSPTGFCFLVPL